MEREKEDRLIGQLREQANDLLAAVHLLTPLVRSQGAEKDTQCLAAMNQSLYRLIKECIVVMADETRRYDDRNRASHEEAKRIMEYLNANGRNIPLR